MLFGVLCLALGCIMMYFVGSLWAFLLVWGLVIGSGFSLGCTIITDKAIVNWFIRKSGIALNIKFAIQSLSGLLLLPVIAWLIATQGWQLTCLVSGIVIALVSSPLVWFFIKPHPPEHYGYLPDGVDKKGEAPDTNQIIGKGVGYAGGAEAVEFTLRQTMKTPTFWLIVSMAYISGLVMPIMGVHCIPFLTDMGINSVKAASMMGLMSVVSVPARLVTGFIVDRMKTSHLRFIIAAGYLLQAIGVAAFLLNKSTAMIYVWFLLTGIGGGISQSVSLPMWARYFGRKAFGSIIGSAMAMNMLVGLIAPIFVGWVYDTTGSYMGIIPWIAPLLAATGLVACFILPPKLPALATTASQVV